MLTTDIRGLLSPKEAGITADEIAAAKETQDKLQAMLARQAEYDWKNAHGDYVALKAKAVQDGDLVALEELGRPEDLARRYSIVCSGIGQMIDAHIQTSAKPHEPMLRKIERALARKVDEIEAGEKKTASTLGVTWTPSAGASAARAQLVALRDGIEQLDRGVDLTPIFRNFL